MTEAALLALRTRISQTLGWSLEDCQSFSLPTLRELVRSKDMKLCADLDHVIATGQHVATPYTPRRRRT